MELQEKKRLITTKELLKAIQICPASLVAYKKRNMIPFVKIGNSHRYDLNKVIEALEKNSK